MTRATLLQVLARPTALGPAEVRELEQLAQAFPYCQTAHLLLAKAAHDHGTMLAGQRLRRAATYAADRTLLRRLIEEVAPVAEPESVSEVEVVPAALVSEQLAAESSIVLPVVEALAPVPAVVPAPVVEAAAVSAPLPVVQASPAAPVVSEAAAVPKVVPEAEVSASVMEAAAPVVVQAPAAPAEATQAPAPPLAEIPTKEIAPVATPIVDAEAQAAPTETIPMAESAGPIEAVPVLAAEAQPAPEAERVEISNAEETLTPAPSPDASILPVLVDQEGVHIPAASPMPEPMPEAVPEEEPDLPAQAPAIRPPVEAGEARFEFGLAEPPPAPPAYELPGLVDEWAAAAVTLSLGGPAPIADLLPAGANATPAPPVLTPAAFTGDTTIGYGFGESSRLGFSMQLLHLLTDEAEKNFAETAAQPPAAPLPPPGAFFEPDPLLLNHWATHCPPVPVLPSSLELINNFLKRQPRLTRPGMLPPAPGGQTDLSVRSTRAEPDLVSENLARIFVRQGKTARAIEIYEKLMVKQPEKMAYFAAQIQSLQPLA
ncbi:hypothetical protein [Hymenobacter convexus]|uniref:hypothetical protein n=1 Tax=Hymenobacter sp. CA1UV-4 TaxID=3063782 RepID=UPI002712B41C|nr:hypothetical protein [Hymenobacter sp. CA1UV-4]MDO7852332.1 hypothetical protein [Hymenobacter sp. CA1UV-4]